MAKRRNSLTSIYCSNNKNSKLAGVQKNNAWLILTRITFKEKDFGRITKQPSFSWQCLCYSFESIHVCFCYFQGLLEHIIFGYGPFNEEPTSKNHHCPGQVIHCTWTNQRKEQRNAHTNTNKYNVFYISFLNDVEGRSIMLVKINFW